jgi:signal transduction histidine kinase
MRGDERLLAEEQAAFRRVATLVARGAAPEEVFAAAVEEVGRLLPVDLVSMGRYESDRAMTFVTSWGRSVDFVPIGSRLTLGGRNLNTTVFETGRPARIDNYADASGPIGLAAHDGGVRSAAGAPIVVEGRLWGMIAAGSSGEGRLPADTEARLASFAELLAMAIANAESRARLASLAEEQAALRRVATLVARGALPEEVFAGVAEEVQRLLRVDIAGMGRYQPDGTLAVVASWGRAGPVFPVRTQYSLGGRDIGTIVFETGLPARVEVDAADAPTGGAGEMDFRSSVGTPIVVDGRLWGLMGAGSSLEPLPLDTEARLAEFTELLATAVANAESRAALAASRARVVAASDETRRRIERDLHDGAQQRLVALGLQLRAAQAALPPQFDAVERELSRVAEGLASVLEELREIARGIHPGLLFEGGLKPALRALARRSTVPVELDLHTEQRLPEHVEVAAYYGVSEALTNAAKHAHASLVHIDLAVQDTTVRLAIRDDGIGGADPAHGSGLVGLSDRIETLGGTFEVTSATGSGTTLVIEIPVEIQSSEPSPDS